MDKKEIMNNSPGQYISFDDFAIHIIDYKHNNSSIPLPKCHLINLGKKMLSSGSIIFASAFEANNNGTKKFADQSSEMISHQCEHYKEIMNSPFVEFHSTPHRSFEVLIDFFEAFKPFANYRKKMNISNVTEWIELAEEYSIIIIQDECLRIIKKWLRNPTEDVKTQSFISLSLLSTLEKFHFDDLLNSTLEFVCNQQKWEYFPLSPHWQCCGSKNVLFKLLKIHESTDIISLTVKSSQIFECQDSCKNLCLVKILEKKDEKKEFLSCKSQVFRVGITMGYLDRK